METIKTTICKCTTKGAKSGFTMKNLLAALDSGLGVRKKEWNQGYFVYMLNGVLMNGNLNEPCRQDTPRRDSFAFDTDIASWEIIDANYLKLIAIRKSVLALDNIKDAATVSKIATALKISL